MDAMIKKFLNLDGLDEEITKYQKARDDAFAAYRSKIGEIDEKLKQLRGVKRLADPNAFKTPKVREKVLEFLDDNSPTFYSAAKVAEGICKEMWNTDEPTGNNKISVSNALKKLATENENVSTDKDGKTILYCYSEE